MCSSDLPAGVTLLTAPTTSICHVAKIVVQEAAPAPAAAATEAAPAGDKPGDKPADKAAEKPAEKDKK